MSIFDLSSYLQWLGSFFIILAVFYPFEKRPSYVFILGIYGLNSFLFQFFQEVSMVFLNMRYSPQLGNIYVLLETLILLLLFYHLLNRKILRRLITLTSILYFIFFVIVISNELSIMSSPTRTMRDFLMICCSLIYFITILKELPKENLLEVPGFWFVAGILFFFSCTFILSLSLRYIAEVLGENMGYFWSVRNFLRACFCGVICIGIWKARKQAYKIE